MKNFWQFLKQVDGLGKILPMLLVMLTDQPRYLPEIKWSSNSWVHNIFRLYELIFGRRNGIRIESSSMRYTDKKGNRVTKYKIYTFEAFCAYTETWIRNLFTVKWWKVELVHYQFAVPSQELRIPFISFAIAYDTTSNGGNAAATSSDSWSHTVTGTDAIVVGGSGVRDATAGDRNATAFTYNTVTLAEIRPDDNAIDLRTELWELEGPATGANTAAITWGGSITTGAGTMTSLTGVDQTTPNDANNGATGSSAAASTSVVTVANNAWIVDIMITTEAAASDIIPGGHASHTQRLELSLTSDNLCVGTAGAITPAGSTTVSWSWTGTETWAITAASFKPAVAPIPNKIFSYQQAVKRASFH